VLVGATGGHFAGNASVRRMHWVAPTSVRSVRVLSILDEIAQLTSELNAYQPTVLASYPSAAALLAEEQLAGRLAISPREVWTAGETLTQAQRARIVEAFGCIVRNDYGASEFLAIGWECSRGRMHVNTDWLILEPIDENGRPVPRGVASYSVLLTNLANRVQPLIRYDLGDSITLLDETCDCGCALPLIDVQGRCDEVLRMRSGHSEVALLPLALTTVLEENAGLFRFQLVQTAADRLLLRVGGETAEAGLLPNCRARLEEYLRAQGLPGVAIEIEISLPRTHARSGKLKRIVVQMH
jgi:phenylacetate-coenzyme A ligase PaaK-like adenylate-forming protein